MLRARASRILGLLAAGVCGVVVGACGGGHVQANAVPARAATATVAAGSGTGAAPAQSVTAAAATTAAVTVPTATRTTTAAAATSTAGFNTTTLQTVTSPGVTTTTASGASAPIPNIGCPSGDTQVGYGCEYRGADPADNPSGDVNPAHCPTGMAAVDGGCTRGSAS